VLLHVGVSLVLLALATRWLGSRQAGLAAAALFAVHPVHTQSVTWIAGRTDLFAALFFLAALLLQQMAVDAAHGRAPGHARPETPAGGPGARRLGGTLALQGLALFALALALLSKEMAVTYPAALILHLLLVSRIERKEGPGPRRWWSPLIASVVVASAYLVLRLILVGGIAGYADDPHAWWSPEDGTASRLLAVPLILAFYIRRTLFPWWLGFESGIEPVTGTPGLAWAAASAGLALTALLAYRFRRRDPAVAFGVAWFFVTILPVANIHPIFESAMEHFAYLPSAGLVIAAVALGRRLVKSPAARVIGCALLVALLGTRTIARNFDWRDEERFWRVTTRDTPSARAYNNLGLHLRDQGRLDEAAEALFMARLLAPDLPSSYYNLGAVASAQSRRDEAIRLFNQALELDPRNAEALYNLALTLETNGYGQRYGPGFPAGEVIATYDRLLAAHPDHAEGWTNLGVLHERLNRPRQAATAFEHAIEAAPTLPEPHLFLASILWNSGDRHRAAALYRRYLELAPDGEYAAEARIRATP
jgi:tetratricopeptide (TPR) repeat protein